MTRGQALGEMALFAGAAGAGVFGLGQAFHGNALWLGVTAVAAMVLARQMARVQDRWPHRSPRRSRGERASPGGRAWTTRELWRSILQPGRVMRENAGVRSGPAEPDRESSS